MVAMGFGIMPMGAEDYPTILPTATFIKTDGTEETIVMAASSEGEGASESGSSYEGSAPLVGRFMANPSDVGMWNEYYEWRFYREGREDAPYLIRYEQDTEYTFVESGSHRIVCYAVFTQGNDTVAYTKEYWDGVGALELSISESKLEMPNAFSPNHDDINDIYKAKKGHQSIVEFHATIYNRWGQKLYEWNDPDGGWDGTYKGKDVKQGVYYVAVRARGADGRVFNIKRDVNLLRGYTETTGSTGSSTTGGDD